MGEQDKADSLGQPLHKSQLASTGAVTALGLAAVKQLAIYGIVCLHLDLEGYVQVARPGEVTLDALPEPMALQQLQAQDYTDDELAEYLKGRDARLRR